MSAFLNLPLPGLGATLALSGDQGQVRKHTELTYAETLPSYMASHMSPTSPFSCPQSEEETWQRA